jgi:hypothetical protein
LYAILILVSLNIFCFFRSFNGFFLADDFSHIDYLHNVFAGHPEMLLQNFFSNWLQAQGTKFFRPFISITLAWDYLFWKNNPVGFHITNVSLQIASTVLLFFIVKRLFPISKNRSFALALASAAIFAVNPLHPEVVSWIIARVDSVAATFLLAAFYLHQRGLGRPKTSWFKISSFASFLIALMSKETAIVLPAVLFMWHLIFPRNSDASAKTIAEQYTLVQRFKYALSETWLYWSILLVYLCYRAVALGTMIGGYGGAVGEGLHSSFLRRWTDPVSIEKVFFPFNDEVFHNSSRLKRWLRWMYQAGAVLFVANSLFALRCKKLTQYWSMVLFAGAWFLISMVPAYQVWNLSANLQGSRFIYMGSIPLALLFSLLVIPVFWRARKTATETIGSRHDANDKSDSESQSIENSTYDHPREHDPIYPAVGSTLTALSGTICIAFVLVCANIAQKNDSAWFHAGKGVKALFNEIKLVLASTPANKQIVLLNLPFRYQGAHMLYNGFTFGALLRPPFMPEDNSKRVQLFEPVEFGDSDLLNLSRLKTIVNGPGKPQVYKWNESDNKLLPVTLNWESQKVDFTKNGATLVDKGQLVYAPKVSLPSGGIDYLLVSMTASNAGKSVSQLEPEFVKLIWSGSSMTFAPENFLWCKLVHRGNKLIATFNVSEHKRWIETGTITRIGFQLLPAQKYTITDLQILSGNLKDLPVLTASLPADTMSGGMTQDELGMAHPHTKIGYLHYDASRITGADHVVFQISKPDSWFEQASDTFRSNEKENSQVELAHVVKMLKGDLIAFPTSELKGPGFYEVRVGAAAKNGDILIGYSDPINFYISEADIHASK